MIARYAGARYRRSTRRRGHGLARVLEIAAACAAVALTSGAANAVASSRWTADWPPTPTRLMSGSLTGVSCTWRSMCIAVGPFTDKADATAPLAEHWNGGRWALRSLPIPIRSRNVRLMGVSCPSSRVCVAVGEFENRSYSSFPLIERWDGSHWTIEQASTRRNLHGASLISVSCTATAECSAVGSSSMTERPFVERWNGSRWSTQVTPRAGNGSSLYSVSCSWRRACAAVGDFIDPKTHCENPLLERWNGGRWSLQRGPKLGGCGSSTTLNEVSCPVRRFCMAVGYNDPRTRATGIGLPLVERWNGTTWKVSRTPDITYLEDPWGGGGTLISVSCTSARSCTAVGHGGSDIIIRPLIEHWNGARWMIDPTPSVPLDGGLNGVSCTTTTTCMAVGYDDSPAQSDSVPLAESTLGPRGPIVGLG